MDVNKIRSHFNGIPAPPEESFIRSLIVAVCEAGDMIRGIDRTAEVKAGDGHRSIVTEADRVSNHYIVGKLVKLYPEIRLLCEEESADKHVLSRNAPTGLLDVCEAAVVDSLDGTTRFAGNYPDWCVAGGSLSNGIVNGGVITAPDANGGITCFSSPETGPCFMEGLRLPRPIPKISGKPTLSSVILRGVDTELYKNVLAIMPRIAASVRAVYTEGSGLFALMSVALGRAAAVIQTPQKAWDWVPAYHMLKSAGGVFRFFRLDKGNLIPAEHYDFDAFTYKKENRLGFVAGEPSMVEKLFAMLPATGWERHDPDTI